ncbi:GNAT family N-acetyltransferase [Maribacter sp. SA7]|uniref:GNAT family N-acetyltransferase n=1 Tax=Maribacter zhoushanensis TaxID=3030012 RepID=UPI0023EC3FA1|nr:GNAT family N-acetyltransferase [Maribacter zhoushanensis]MDF4201430.1 GNAT family N-acetyltransferase [Maribacter zhoushanensis]
MLDIKVKNFKEFDIEELYNVLQLRSEIFVVEQDCVYQDIDGKDSKAIHVIGYKNNSVVAYTRIFKPGDYFDQASIGRVAVHKDFRKFGYGKVIMQASIDAVEEHYNTYEIKISAQKYLTKFYTDLGFNATGEEYLEDGIPHIAMIKK